MATDLKEQITEYLAKCRVCAIATVNSDGQPNASTVFFRNRGTDIYFNTGKETQKVRNILGNPHVALVMQAAGPVPETDQDIKGVQYVGRATMLPEGDTGEVPKAVLFRHTAFNSARPGNSVIIKVTPAAIYLIDYSRGFRHRDVVTF